MIQKKELRIFTLLFIAGMLACGIINAQTEGDPKLTEIYSPVPPVVTPGNSFSDAPSDAIILFDGKNLDQWINVKDSTAAKWTLGDNAMTVNKSSGDIQTRAVFTDYQLHIEYRIPADITGSGQARGNSGIFLASLPWGAGGYELQVLDNYKNSTYVNGQAGSMYKQAIPLANACRKPGEWQTYDVVWTAPRFTETGLLKSLARVTVFHNGVLVQNNTTLLGDTPYIGMPSYRKHGAAPLKLQAHGDKSEPISYRNIWIRPL
jgi:3-keto-disaccharide hydrolase